MKSVPFTLVSTEQPDLVFAFGLEIVRDGNVEEAVTFRREPDGGQVMFGAHASAESARARFSLVTPLTLLWQDETVKA